MNPMQTALDAQLEAILFFKGEAVTVARLAEIVKKDPNEVTAALDILSTKLVDRGLTIVWNGNPQDPKDREVVLGTAPSLSPLIAELTKEELTRDLGKAGLETLSIVLYRGPLARREIDYIRGVNSTFILRNLMIRGLVEKIPSPKDQRALLYKPTVELLRFMGITKVEDLPEFTSLRQEIEAFEKKDTDEAAVDQ
jgi:segregation and condensation protein B